MEFLKADEAIGEFMTNLKGAQKEKVIDKELKDYASWVKLGLPDEADVLPELYAMVLSREKLYRADVYLDTGQKEQIEALDEKVREHFKSTGKANLAGSIQEAAQFSSVPSKLQWWWWLGG